MSKASGFEMQISTLQMLASQGEQVSPARTMPDRQDQDGTRHHKIWSLLHLDRGRIPHGEKVPADGDGEVGEWNNRYRLGPIISHC